MAREATILIFEVVGTGRDLDASQQSAVEVIKQTVRTLTGLQANVECCEVLEVKTPKAYERAVRYSKGSP